MAAWFLLALGNCTTQYSGDIISPQSGQSSVVDWVTVLFHLAHNPMSGTCWSCTAASPFGELFLQANIRAEHANLYMQHGGLLATLALPLPLAHC